MEALEFVNNIATMLGWETVTTIEGTVDKETENIVNASNVVLTSLQGDKDWSELRVDARLQLARSEIFDGIITATYGSTTLTCDAGLFSVGDVGKAIQVGYSKVAYRVSAYIDVNTVTLDRAWAEEDYLSDEDGHLYVGQDTYELPTDYDRFLVEKLYNSWEDSYAEVVGPQALSVTRQGYGLGLSIGIPTQCTVHGLNDAGTASKIHFDITPQENYLLNYAYQRKHPALTTDTTQIVYPDKNLMYIMDAVKYRLDRDTEVAQAAGAVANDALRERVRIQQNQESGSDPVRFAPRVGRWGRRRRR